VDSSTGQSVVIEDLNRRVAAEEAAHVLEAMTPAPAAPAATVAREDAHSTVNYGGSAVVIPPRRKAPAKYPSVSV
jgi:hypothetical protein